MGAGIGGERLLVLLRREGVVDDLDDVVVGVVEAILKMMLLV